MKAAIINLALLAASTSAWSIVYHSDSDCRGNVVGHSNLPNAAQSGSVCEVPGNALGSDPSAVVRSARISGLDEELDDEGWGAPTRTKVRFYSNTDCFNNCTHRYILGKKDWEDCVTFYPRNHSSNSRRSDSSSITLKDISFNLVQVGRLGFLSDRNSGEYSSVLSDGFCMLSHGDRVVLHGREYRMQQVAASWFHDIPIEDWDEAVHTKSTENRFVQHGDVDVSGDLKMWQRSAYYSHGVPLEQWNDTIHVKVDADEEAIDNFMYAMDNYCRLVQSSDTATFEDLSIKLPSMNVAKVCEEVKRRLKEVEEQEMVPMAEEFEDVLIKQQNY